MGPELRLSDTTVVLMTGSPTQNVIASSSSVATMEEQSPIQGFKRKRPFGCRGPSKMKDLGGGGVAASSLVVEFQAHGAHIAAANPMARTPSQKTKVV